MNCSPKNPSVSRSSTETERQVVENLISAVLSARKALDEAEWALINATAPASVEWFDAHVDYQPPAGRISVTYSYVGLDHEETGYRYFDICGNPVADQATDFDAVWGLGGAA